MDGKIPPLQRSLVVGLTVLAFVNVLLSALVLARLVLDNILPQIPDSAIAALRIVNPALAGVLSGLIYFLMRSLWKTPRMRWEAPTVAVLSVGLVCLMAVFLLVFLQSGIRLRAEASVSATPVDAPWGAGTAGGSAALGPGEMPKAPTTNPFADPAARVPAALPASGLKAYLEDRSFLWGLAGNSGCLSMLILVMLLVNCVTATPAWASTDAPPPAVPGAEAGTTECRYSAGALMLPVALVAGIVGLAVIILFTLFPQPQSSPRLLAGEAAAGLGAAVLCVLCMMLLTQMAGTRLTLAGGVLTLARGSARTALPVADVTAVEYHSGLCGRHGGRLFGEVRIRGGAQVVRFFNVIGNGRDLLARLHRESARPEVKKNIEECDLYAVFHDAPVRIGAWWFCLASVAAFFAIFLTYLPRP